MLHRGYTGPRAVQVTVWRLKLLVLTARLALYLEVKLLVDGGTVRTRCCQKSYFATLI